MPESKFKIFDTTKNNTFNDGESFTSFDNGFEPGDVVESKPVNTGLYQSTLITKAFIDALGDSSNIGYSTSYEDLVQYIKTKFTDLGGVIQAKNLTITTDAVTLEWNKIYYKINKTVATENTITLGSINDSIKNEITVMLTTNVVNTKIRFAGVASVYLINHGTTNVTDSGLLFTFQDKGTYILKFFAKNPSVVYMETSKGEYSATTYLSNPEVTVNAMSSPQGAYPRLSFVVKNPNTVTIKPTFGGDASGITVVNISANGSNTFSKAMNKYEGSFSVSISDPNSQVLGNPSASKSWSVTPTFAKPTISFSGTGTSRTVTINRTQGQGGSTTTTDYKVWKSNESEPSAYTNTADAAYTQTLANNTYNSIIYKVKARTKAVYSGKTTYTEDVTNQVTIDGQVKPTLKVPTISLVNQTTSQITFKVNNSNNVACNIYWKVTGGSFQLYDSKVNPNASLDCTITTSVKPTTIMVYLSATNYVNSTQASLEVSKPNLLAPAISNKNITYEGGSFVVTNNNDVAVNLYLKKGSGTSDLIMTLTKSGHTNIELGPNNERPISYIVEFRANNFNNASTTVDISKLPQRRIEKTINVTDTCKGVGKFKTCQATLTADTASDITFIKSFEAVLSFGSSARQCCQGSTCVATNGCPYKFKTIEWEPSITVDNVRYYYSSNKSNTGVGYTFVTGIYLEADY